MSNQNPKDNRISKITENIKKNPTFELYRERAECYFNIGNYNGSIEDYTTSLEMIFEDDSEESREKKADALLGRGESYYGVGEYEKALHDYTSLLEDPNPVGRKDILFNKLGLCHQRLGNFEESYHCFTRAIENYPVENSMEDESTGNGDGLPLYFFNRSLSCEGMIPNDEDGRWRNQFVRDMCKAIESYKKDEDVEDLKVCYKLLLPYLEERDPEERRKKSKILDFIIEHETEVQNIVKFSDLRIRLAIKMREYGRAIELLNSLLDNINKKQTEVITDLKLCSYYIERAYCKAGMDKSPYSVINDLNLADQYMKPTSEYLDLYIEKAKIYRFIDDDDKMAMKTISEAIEIDHPDIFKKHKVRKYRGDMYLEKRKYKKMISDYVHTLVTMKSHQVRENFMSSVIIADLCDLVGSFYDCRRRTTAAGVHHEISETLSDDKCNKYAKKILNYLISKTEKFKLEVDPNLLDLNSVDWCLINWYNQRGDLYYLLDDYKRCIADLETESSLCKKLGRQEDEHSIYIRFRSYYTSELFKKAIQDGLLYLSIAKITSKESEERYKKVCNLMRKIHRDYYHRDKARNNEESKHDEFSFLFERLGKKTSKKLPKKYRCREGKQTALKSISFITNNSIKYRFTERMRRKPNDDFLDFIAVHISSSNKKLKFLTKHILVKKFVSGESGKLINSFVRNNYFYGSNNQKLDERISLAIDSLGSDNYLELECISSSNRSKIRIPHYFLKTNHDDLEETTRTIFFGDAPVVGEILFLKCLFGYKLSESEVSELMIPLYIIFRNLNMLSHLYVLLTDMAERQLSLSDSIFIFTNCVVLFENEKIVSASPSPCSQGWDSSTIDTVKNILVSGDSNASPLSSGGRSLKVFSCSLTLALFRKLKKKIKEIEKVDNFVQALETIVYFGKLKSNKYYTKGILKHSDLRGTSFIQRSSFSKIFEQDVLKRIFRTKEFSGIKLRTKDMSTVVLRDERIKVHKEVLILRSTFFFRMFSYPGAEAEVTSVVDIENLSKNSLQFLLELIYLGDHSRIEDRDSMNLRSVFELLIHSQMYDEFLLTLKQIDYWMNAALNEGVFVLKILEMGKYFGWLNGNNNNNNDENYGSSLRYFLTKRWEAIATSRPSLSFKEISALIENSIRTDQLTKRIDLQNLELEGLKQHGEKRKRGREKTSSTTPTSKRIKKEGE